MTTGHCEVRLTRRYDAAPAEVWAALTERERIARWLGPVVAADIAPGGGLELELGVVANVRELQPERVLELDWRMRGEDASVVRIELAGDGDGTLLVLDHRRIDEPVGMAYIARWTSALARFKRVLGAPS